MPDDFATALAKAKAPKKPPAFGEALAMSRGVGNVREAIYGDVTPESMTTMAATRDAAPADDATIDALLETQGHNQRVESEIAKWRKELDRGSFPGIFKPAPSEQALAFERMGEEGYRKAERDLAVKRMGGVPTAGRARQTIDEAKAQAQLAEDESALRREENPVLRFAARTAVGFKEQLENAGAYVRENIVRPFYPEAARGMDVVAQKYGMSEEGKAVIRQDTKGVGGDIAEMVGQTAAFIPQVALGGVPGAAAVSAAAAGGDVMAGVETAVFLKSAGALTKLFGGASESVVRQVLAEGGGLTAAGVATRLGFHGDPGTLQQAGVDALSGLAFGVMGGGVRAREAAAKFKSALEMGKTIEAAAAESGIPAERLRVPPVPETAWMREGKFETAKDVMPTETPWGVQVPKPASPTPGVEAPILTVPDSPNLKTGKSATKVLAEATKRAEAVAPVNEALRRFEERTGIKASPESSAPTKPVSEAPERMVRVYRGEAPEGVPGQEWLRSIDRDRRGRWFTTDRKTAGDYAGDAGKIIEVEVPESVWRKAQVEAGRGREGGVGEAGAGVLPAEWVSGTKPVSVAPKAPAEAPKAPAEAPKATPKVEPAPVEAPQTGKPWEGTVYRGQGDSGYAAHGEGSYYGMERAGAERFSVPGTVTESVVSLRNPYVVKSDADVTAMRKAASAASGEPINSDWAVLLEKNSPESVALSKGLSKMGHDGVIVDFPEAAGGRQVVVLPKAEAPKPKPVTPPVEAPRPEGVSIKNAAVEADRAARGATPLPETTPEKQADWVKEATRRIAENPNYPVELIDSLKRTGRPHDKVEVAALTEHRVRLNESLAKAEADVIKAAERGDLDAVKEAKIRADNLRTQDYEVSEIVGKAAGAEAARALGARAMALDKQYELLPMETTRRVVNEGRPLTEAQKASTKAIHDEMVALRKKVAAYEAGKTQRSGPVVTADKVRSAEYGKRNTLVTREAYDATRAVIRDKLSRMSAGIDPTLLVDLAKVGAFHVEAGARSFASWSKAMVADLGEKVQPHLREIWRAAQIHMGEPGQGDAKRLAALKSRLHTRIADREARMAMGKIEKPPVREPVKRDAEAIRLEAERDMIERKWQRELMVDAWKQKSIAQKAGSLAISGSRNLSRALMTAWDFSAPLRQGAILSVSHPVKAAKALGPMFRAFASKEHQALVEAEMRLDPMYGPAKRSGLFLSEHADSSVAKMEENLVSGWIEKIPGVGASQRAYTTFLNKLRFDVFKGGVENLSSGRTPTPLEMKTWANFVNVATGRGGPPDSKILNSLNNVFFAPRLAVSRFQILLGTPMWRGTAATRKMVAMEYAKSMSGLAVFYGLAKLAGGDIEKDGKVRFGDSVLDPTAGLASASKLMQQTAPGVAKAVTGQRRESRSFGQGDEVTAVGRYLRGKLAPLPGAALNLASGKDPVGKPVTLGSEAVNLTTPMSYRDIYKAMQEHGVPRGAALGILSLFGMGLQNYRKRGR